MDQPVPNQPQVIVPFSPSKFAFLFRNLKFTLTLVCSVVFLLLILLHYFNVLTLPKTKPQNAKPEEKLSYSCPVNRSYCAQGLTISLPNTRPQFEGLAYQGLASGSAVLAIIPGKFTTAVSLGKNTEKITILTIVNEQFGIEANYQFKGKEYSPIGGDPGQVKLGETIGWVSDKNLEDAFGQPYGLIVSIRDLKTKEFIKLDTQALK